MERMKPSLDRLELMQTFVRIVEAGNLSAAAAQMGTTQPTVSRRLQALERSLGLSLVQRTTHAMTLTETGRRTYERAKQMLAAWGELESELRGAVDEPQGLLRVVVPHAFGQQHLIGPLADFFARYPQVSVEWMLRDSPPHFAEQGIDCAIRVGPVTDPSVIVRKIGEVPRIIIAAPALVRGRVLPKEPDELLAFPWLALGPFYRNEIVLSRESGAERKLAIRPRLTTDSVYALRSAAVHGIGVGACSMWVVEDELARGTLVQLTPAWRAASLPIYVVYPKAAHYPAKLRRFVEIMRDAMDILPSRERPMGRKDGSRDGSARQPAKGRGAARAYRSRRPAASG